jgi:hypothetical protein
MLPLIACSLLSALAFQTHAEPPAQAQAVRLLDVTGDGSLDKLILGADGSLAVAVHGGRRSYRLIEQELPTALVQDVLVSDFDGDGSPDLYLVSPAANVLLRGDGTGYFTEETARFGLADEGAGLSAERLDLDADGLVDLLLHNMTGDVLFWARADGSFDRDADSSGAEAAGAGPSGAPAGAADVAGKLVDPAGPITPPLTLSSGPTIGSGGTMGVDLRASGADSRRPDATGTVPPLVILPALLSSLEDLFVNDDSNEVDSADVIDGSLTGPDVSTSIGNVGIGTLSPAETLHVVGNARFEHASNARTIEIDGNGQIDSSATLTLNLNSSGSVKVAEGGGNFFVGPTGAPTMTITNAGRVGVGTGTPGRPLDLHADNHGFRHLSPTHGADVTTYANNQGGWIGTVGDHPFHLYTENSQPRVTLDTSGRLGVGTTDPQAKLHVHGYGLFTDPSWANFRLESTSASLSVDRGAAGEAHVRFSTDDTLEWFVGLDNFPAANVADYSIKRTNNGEPEFVIKKDTGFVGIGTGTPGTTLDVDGAITIRGGADIVESFESSCGVLEPGTVVAIDPDHPGMLMCAAQAYDTKVAGVVSGAGGVNPGLLLGQDDMFSGDTKVAMTGRVYVKCSSEGGPVRPGDRLTTSSLDGHAMRVADGSRAGGAVIGKAMSSLDEGTGLVLVLVNLQ